MWMVNMVLVMVVVVGGLFWCLYHISIAKDGE